MVRRWLAICSGVCAAAVVGPAGAVAQPAPRPLPPAAVAAGPNAVVADPGLGNPLPTDGLMAPAPIVPPRNSYQRPPAPRPPDDDPGPPVRPEPPDLRLENGIAIPIPEAISRNFRFIPRYGRLNNFSSEKLADGSTRALFTGGVIVNVSPGPGQPEMEFAADDLVVWVRGGGAVDNLSAGFEASQDNKREVEVYLSGNVIVRTTTLNGAQPVSQTLRADEVYYDVARNRAIALAADLEMSAARLPDAVHLKGREVRRLDVENWEILDSHMFSSKLPSDPGLRFDSPRITLRERQVERTNIFGIPYRTLDGEPVQGWERILTVRNSVTRLNGVPVFYLPYLRTDATEPLGPLLGLGFGVDRIFGTQFYSTWDLYKLLALKNPVGHKWRLNLDYLGDRGPAAGSDYTYTLPPAEPGLPVRGRGFARVYALNDTGIDIVGGGRGPEPTHPETRGRAMWRHQQEVIEGMYFQGQAAYLSDKNFLEQYYKAEFDLGPNQETFAYLTYQHENRWASGLVMPRVGRDWETQTEWLPRVDGAVVGQSVLDLFSYTARANAAYAQLKPAEVNPLPVLPTDRRTETGRLDLFQEVSAPFDLGPFKVAPYGVLDLAYYSEDLKGDDRGRVYGGGGVRSSLPLTRLYEDVSSELFNLRGLNHKVTFASNYYYARSNVRYYDLPQLDRLNDDQIDRTYRNARPYQPLFVSGPAGQALATSPIFDAQQYAIRRLVDNRVDTLDDIHVLQGDVRQRFQTKRGYPGLEHTVDFFTLDLSGSYFPNPARDNYGKTVSFLEYNAVWHPGDRVSVLSAGWFDPFDVGARYWNAGVSLDRPDRTSFYLGYRQTDPLNSKAVTAVVGYQLSQRYYTNVGANYDFGIQRALSNSFSITRTGSDLTFTVGVTYNALVNNFGVQFLVIPNLLANAAPGRFQALGSNTLGR